MLRNKVKKLTATVLATSMLYGCIAPQIYSWKTESVIDTEFQPIKQETVPEMRYEITSAFTDNGTMDIVAERNWYAVSYDFLTPINIERQREYSYGKSKAAAKATNIGFGSAALGGIFLYLGKDGTNDALVGIGTTGLLVGVITTYGVGLPFLVRPKKERPTQHYRELEIPLDSIVKRKKSSTVTAIHPAAAIDIQIKAAAFTVNGQYTADITTDETGHAIVQLEPTNPNFAFSVDDVANTDVAKQLKKAGIPKQKYLPLLQNAAVPISYDVVIETKATDGENATETVHVSGYEIQALEEIIMSL